jgi:nicotinate phosphoribosyltransferase
MQEYAGLPRRKRSEHKATWPGRKQVWRRYDASGRMAGDLLSLESHDKVGEPLIGVMMKNGKRIAPSPSLDEIGRHAKRELERLPADLSRLKPGASYPVEVAADLVKLAADVDSRLRQRDAAS